MSDFTIEYHQQCSKSTPHAQFSVRGYSQFWDMMGGLQCTCKGFQFRKTCKHVREIEDNLCSWHSAWSDKVQTEEQEQNHVCPECGGSTETVRVAV